MRRMLIAAAICLSLTGSVRALDQVAFQRNKITLRIEGKLIVSARDGGLLLMTTDGRLWAIMPDELLRHSEDDRPYKPLSISEMSKRLIDEMPADFKFRTTKRGVICYNTSSAYAGWCASLYERLYSALTNFWAAKGIDLHEPDFPLAVIVFADKQSFADFARPETGDAVEAITGYYSLQTNRMVTYDLTGGESSGQPRERTTVASINRILARPGAERAVATIVQQATLQIAFNCGLLTRFADIPQWFSIGMGSYFEAPDLRSAMGWRSIGEVNQLRLVRFRRYLERRPADSLATLLRDDKRLQDTRQAADAYSEAWALTYYLIRQHPKEYVSYVRLISRKKPLMWDDEDTRLSDFRQAFARDLQRLDADFVRYMSRLQ